jgi:hypothetical protein
MLLDLDLDLESFLLGWDWILLIFGKELELSGCFGEVSYRCELRLIKGGASLCG